MSLLTTVLTYNLPSEADVDRAFLESQGINVCLLNANTSRNELGAPFFIRLQVPREEYQEAVRLLREVVPHRFGSASRVEEIDREIKRTLFRFLIGAIPIGIATFYLLPLPAHQTLDNVVQQRPTIVPDIRIEVAVALAIIGGIAFLKFAKSISKS